MLLLLSFVYSLYIYIPSISEYMWIGMAPEPHAGPFFIASEFFISELKDSPVDMIFKDKKTERMLCIEKNRNSLVAVRRCIYSNNLFRIIRDITGRYRIMQNEKCLQYFENQKIFYLRTCSRNQNQLFEFLNEKPRKYPKTKYEYENLFFI